MKNRDDLNDSREGLLREEKPLPLRPSLDNAYKSSSEDEDLDELELLDHDYNDETNRVRRWKKQSSYAYENNKNLTQRGQGLWRRFRGLFKAPSRLCLVLTFISCVVLTGIIASWLFLLYKRAPIDGYSPPWYPTPRGGTLKSWEESYKKAEVIVKKMSLMEKVNITTGTGWSMGMCVGNTGPAVNAGFPSLCLQDGPLGLRFADHSTAFPAGITVGATWNKVLMYKRGRAHGLEARLKGINILLGPCMGPLGRMPAGGRNWEGFGSDPVLQGIASAETIKGIQDEGVIATAKHYILNEQEHFRQSWEWGLPNAMSSNLDDRTLHELYLWPFADSVRAGVGSVMCSYNMVNNSYACGNSKLINGILKDELGFQGFVQSDWLAQRSGVASALAGLDMTMPGDGLFWANGESLWGSHLTKSVLNGTLPMERVDDMVTRVVAAWYQLGQDDEAKWPAPPPYGDGGPNFSSWTDDEIGLIHHGSDDKATAVVNKFVDVQGTGDDFHGRLAQRIAAEGTILLKNDGGILPLSRTGWPSDKKPSEPIRYRVGIFGEDAGPAKGGANACPDRSCNEGTLASGWGSGAVDFPYLVAPLKALEAAFDFKLVNLTVDLTNAAKSSSILESQDLCIVFVNSDGGEGYLSWNGVRGDRNDLNLQKDGDRLIQSVAQKCGGEVIVVIHAVGPVILESWIDLPTVKGVVLANLPGEESGNALVDILFGDLDASGRLPYTIGKSLADYGPSAPILYYPNALVPQQTFDEGLLIDYRHFDAHNISPRYPFGHGLSYTSFSFTNLSLTTLLGKSPLPAPRPAPARSPPSYNSLVPDPASAVFPPGFRRLAKYVYPYIQRVSEARPTRPYPYPHGYDTAQVPSPAGGGEGGNPDLYTEHVRVSITITNTGARAGQEVAQLYVSFPKDVVDEVSGETVEFPVRVLRGFEKVELRPGESTMVEMLLTRRDLSYWSAGAQNWVMPQGEFGVGVGRSSRDLELTGKW